MRIEPFAPAFLLVLLFNFASEVKAQFYAPETEYHDPVQRMFVVEAARVLAWLHNAQSNSPIAEIRYAVETKSDQSTHWKLEWLGPAGKRVSSDSITYPRGMLSSGPAFYRAQIRELQKVGWPKPKRGSKEEIAAAYWAAASESPFSREESLVALMALVGTTEAAQGGQCASLAGLMAHSTLPANADRLSLDPLLLARSAAWLALAESGGEVASDDLWAPLLFQAGRVRTATDAWLKQHPARAKGGTVQQMGWDLWLRNPSTRDIYLFAASHENLAMGMPMMAYDVRVTRNGTLLGDLLPEMARRDQLTKLHNYGPQLAIWTTIGGGRIMEGGWPALSRAAFFDTLSRYKPGPYDFTNYTNELKKAFAPQRKRLLTDIDDLSLTGLAEAAPLLRLGQTEGAGKLAPTATVTSRDLLNYGWEMAGLQLGQRFMFVRNNWGVPELADRIMKDSTAEVQGILPFFFRAADAKSSVYDASLRRLELVDDFYHRVGFNYPTFPTTSRLKTSAAVFAKRCWLRPRDFEWQARSLWDADDFDLIQEMMEALEKEGGTVAATEVLRYLSAISTDQTSKIRDFTKYAESFPKAYPENARINNGRVHVGNLPGLPGGVPGLPETVTAESLEKNYWRNPDAGGEVEILLGYMNEGRYASLFRFYKQTRANLDPVHFSNMLGRGMFMVAYMRKDDAIRKLALEDSASGSAADMELNMLDCAIRKDIAGLKKTAEEMVERYETEQGQSSRGRLLSAFCDLIPALAEPAHPSRSKALNYFNHSHDWVVLRWILVQQYQLPKKDALTFMGGSDAGPMELCLLAGLEGNLQKVNNAFARQSIGITLAGDAFAVVRFYMATLGQKEKPDKDLRPPGAMSVRQLVREKFEKERK